MPEAASRALRRAETLVSKKVGPDDAAAIAAAAAEQRLHSGGGAAARAQDHAFTPSPRGTIHRWWRRRRRKRNYHFSVYNPPLSPKWLCLETNINPFSSHKRFSNAGKKWGERRRRAFFARFEYTTSLPLFSFWLVWFPRGGARAPNFQVYEALEFLMDK